MKARLLGTLRKPSLSGRISWVEMSLVVFTVTDES